MTETKQVNLRKKVAPYEKTEMKSSVRQLINTLGPLVVLWYGAYLSLSVSYWLTLVLSIVISGFVIRSFIIFHDCTHQSFFKSKLANKIVGTITGIVALVPYEQWKYSHSMHHATSSNLDKRGEGDMWLLTVDEYLEASKWKRLAYRIYRNPIVTFGLGPIAVFLFQYRFNRKGARRKERINTYVVNISIVALYSLLIWAIGWQAFVMIQGPVFFIAGCMGIWLFYVQHQFEDSYFENEDEWDYVKAAVDGSSYYKLPKVLQWFTGNIGFHHVHHLNPRVPNYHLEEAHNATPPLHKATTITISTSLKALNFRLWDEENKGFISFGEMKRRIHQMNSVGEKLNTPRPNLQEK